MSNQPLHPNTVDEHVARLCAGIVVATAAASLFAPLWWIIAVLAVDFVIRGTVGPRYSPLAAASRATVRAAGIPQKPVYAPPKRFAAQVGAAFTIVATVLHLIGAHLGAVVVTGALIGAASLEAFGGICVACWLYPFVFRTGVVRHAD